MGNTPERINNYEELKKPLDASKETEITFNEKGDDFVFQVGEKEYSLSKLNKNLIDVYQMENEKMNLIIKYSDELAWLKNDITQKNKTTENKEENKETLKTPESIDDYITLFKERKKATRNTTKYKDGSAGLELIHKTAEDAIKELKAKKKSLKKAPKWHTNIFNKEKYDTKLEKIWKIRDTSTDSERPTANFQSYDLDDANRNNAYNQETINYQEKFNGLLQQLAKDKFKIKDYARLTRYFQDVIAGKVRNPSQTPFQCENREDYKYLSSLKIKYPEIQTIITAPQENNETSNNTTNNHTNTKIEENIDDSDPTSIAQALKKWWIIDAIGQITKNWLDMVWLKTHLNKQQQNTLRIAGVIGWGILLRKGIRKRWKKKERKVRKVGLVATAADALYFGMTGRELFSSTLKTLFGHGSAESKRLASTIEWHPFNKVKDLEQKAKRRPATLMYALGRAKPSTGVLKVKNGKFEIDKQKFDIEVNTLPENMRQDAIENIELILKAKNTSKVLNDTMKLLGISPKEYQDNNNKNKTIIEIADAQKETQHSQLQYIQKELKERGYEITDEWRYPIYLDRNKDDDIDEKIQERSSSDYIQFSQKWRQQK